MGSDTRRWDGSKLINLPSGGSHNILSATHLDTLVATVIAGDLIYGNATPKWARLPKGTDGQYLKLVTGLPLWADPPAGGADHNLLSATHPDTLAAAVVRGDILIGNATPKWAKLALTANRVLKSGALDVAWGLIVNADVDAEAGIVESKLALNYATHAQAHTLASHTTKAHAELTDVSEDQHHTKIHGDAEHTPTYEKTTNKDIANGYCGLDASTLILLARLPTIPYSKLNLALSIVNADIAVAAAIAESKLALNYPTHAEAHTLTSHTTKAHSELTGVTADQHHAQAHTLASHSTKAHSELTDVTADQHHVRLHALGSTSDHSGTGTIKTTLSFAVVGTLAVGTDKAPTILAPCTLTIVKVKLVVKTAPTGAAIIVDVNKNGTTIFTTQANRPQIAIGATTGDSVAPDVTALAETDKITVDVDQVGSTVAGADLTVEVVTNQNVVFT